MWWMWLDLVVNVVDAPDVGGSDGRHRVSRMYHRFVVALHNT